MSSNLTGCPIASSIKNFARFTTVTNIDVHYCRKRKCTARDFLSLKVETHEFTKSLFAIAVNDKYQGRVNFSKHDAELFVLVTVFVN